MTVITRSLTALAVAGTAATLAAAPASAATNQSGLVNVAATNTTIQVPVGVAANICGVTANVLASATSTAPVDCTATGVAIAQAPGGGGGNTHQQGLVNVSLTNTTVQVPVAIAANVCGVAVNVLAQQIGSGPVTCDALSGATA
jgi:hypothetical protein